ncbi:hypothetical protein FF2_045631 [Malus domestica]
MLEEIRQIQVKTRPLSTKRMSLVLTFRLIYLPPPFTVLGATAIPPPSPIFANPILGYVTNFSPSSCQLPLHPQRDRLQPAEHLRLPLDIALITHPFQIPYPTPHHT